MSIVDGMPTDYGTLYDRWLRNAMYEISDQLEAISERLAAVEAKCAEGGANGAPTDNAHRPTQAAEPTEISFPDWMTPHPATKKKLPEKRAIMGFIPSKAEVQQRIDLLSPGVHYTKQQAGGIWHCSEKVAGAWFFYIGHLVKGLEYDKIIKSYRIPKG